MAIDVSECLSVKAVDWNAIDTVLLDMDGTLLDLRFDNAFWNHHVPSAFAQKNAMSVDEAKTILDPIFARESGQLNWYCLDFWSDTLEFDVAELKRALADGIAWRADARAFLDYLNAHSHDVVLVTNAHPVTLEIKLERINLRPWFHHLVSSHSFGVAKEAQSFWTQLQNAHPFNLERTLFIDDSEAVLRAAEKFGVKHLVTLRRPDSTLPPRTTTTYPAIDQFSEMFDGYHFGA